MYHTIAWLLHCKLLTVSCVLMNVLQVKNATAGLGSLKCKNVMEDCSVLCEMLRHEEMLVILRAGNL